MTYNSIYGNLFKMSKNDNMFNVNQLTKKNLPDFFLKLLVKSKSQKEKELSYHNIFDNKINNKNNNIKIKTTNLNKINNNDSNSINNNIFIKKGEFFSKKSININTFTKRKFIESSSLNIRKKRKIKNEERQHDLFKEKEKESKLQKENIENKDNTYNNFNFHKNLTKSNISTYINANNKTKSKFPNISKSKRILKNNDKQRYQKKFKENYAKLRNFLNHLYFIKKKYKLYNSLSPNLVLNNSKSDNNILPEVKSPKSLKDRMIELMTKLNYKNELDEKNAVNLYIVNICSPIKNFQKDMLSLSRSAFCEKFNLDKKSHSRSNSKNNNSNSFNTIQTLKKNNNMFSPVFKRTKNIKYNTIFNIKKERSFNNNIKTINKRKKTDYEYSITRRNKNYNKTLIKSKSTNELKYINQMQNRIKQYKKMMKNLNNITKNIKLYPIIKTENFIEQYSNEEEVQNNFPNKMIEKYFYLSKKIIFLNKDRYYYKLNKMYNEQLSMYMEHRVNWELIENYNDDSDCSYEEHKVKVNFEWKYYSNKLYYKKYKYNSSIPTKKLCVVNLFEKNYEIGNKKKMFIHLIKYCNKVNLNVFNYVPFTIIINNTRYIEDELNSFKEIFEFIEYQKNKNENILNNDKSIIINRKYDDQFCFDEKIDSIPKQYIYINKNFLSHKNYWILKPTDLYQGKCIEISNSFDEIYKKCKNIFRGVDKRVKPELEDDENDNINNYTYNNNQIPTSSMDEQYDEYIKKKKKKSNIYISNELIIQKYLDNPLLYRKRKFDIRCFVLVDWNLNVFFCREGHLKASSLIYDINNINKFIHITNHSFQKKSLKFEQFECGNEISYNEFKTFLKEEKIPLENFDKILQKMKFLVKLSFMAVGEKLFKTPDVLCFELFGYDFIIDNEYNPWILEINNNPGLSISSPVIEKLVPRMMDDAFRLTIDKIFNTQYSSDCFDINGNYKSRYKLDGYNDNENIFEFLCNIKENDY